MKYTLAWTKTVGSLALGLIILTPAASYAVDLNLPKTQARWEAGASDQEGYGHSGRYMEQEERRMEKKMEEERKQHRNEVRQQSEKRERENGISSRDRQGRSGSGVSVGSSRSRGRGR